MATRVIDAAVDLAVKMLEKMPEDHEVTRAIDVVGQDIEYCLPFRHIQSFSKLSLNNVQNSNCRAVTLAMNPTLSMHDFRCSCRSVWHLCRLS